MASSPRSLSRIGATRICRHFIALILLAQIWAVTQPRASGQLEVIVGKGGEFLAGYIGGKLLDSQVDSWRGIPDVRDLKLKIDELVQVDYEHRGLLRELSYKLDERMTREQVKTLLTESLSRIDERLLKLALRIDKQQRELDQFAKDLGLTRVELTAVNQQVLKHESRLQDQDQKIAEIRRDYPRWNRSEQAAEISASGFVALWRGDHQGALKAFRYAQAFDPDGPEHIYGLAFAHFLAGDTNAAQDVVARGVVAERARPLPRWYARSMEKTFGPHRDFVEKARHDPTYGVFVPGTIRVPTVEAPR